MKQLVFVLGMHRSGTSCVAAALQALGASLGENPMGAGNGNAKGHFESFDVMHLNDQLLAAAGVDWTTDKLLTDSEISHLKAAPLVTHSLPGLLESWFEKWDLIAIKDPRLCLLLPLWADRAFRLGIPFQTVIACRHPLAVAQSLDRRNHINQLHGLLMWKAHVQGSLRYYDPAVTVEYTDLLAAPVAAVHRMAEKLGLLYDKTPTEPLEDYVYDFITPELYHNRMTGGELVNQQLAQLDPEIPILWEKLKTMAEES